MQYATSVESSEYPRKSIRPFVNEIRIIFYIVINKFSPPLSNGIFIVAPLFE